MPRLPITQYPGPYDPNTAQLQWEMDRWIEKHYHPAEPPRPLLIEGEPAKTGTGSLRNRVLTALAPILAIGLILLGHLLAWLFGAF
jgi:hypothetical protein